MDNKTRLISIVCGYKLCYNWKCPFSENDGNKPRCVARRLPDERVYQLFIQTVRTNQDFRSYVFGRDKSLLKGCIMK